MITNRKELSPDVQHKIYIQYINAKGKPRLLAKRFGCTNLVVKRVIEAETRRIAIEKEKAAEKKKNKAQEAIEQIKQLEATNVWQPDYTVGDVYVVKGRIFDSSGNLVKI